LCCPVFYYSLFQTTAYLAMILASLLLILKMRVLAPCTKKVITSTKLFEFESRAAIWDKNRRILATCIGAWLINLAFIIRCTRISCYCTGEPAHSLKRFLALYRYRFSTHESILSLVFSLNRRQSKAQHSKALKSCVLRDGRVNRDTTLATLCSEMILLTFMLAGLVRQRDHYLGRLLFHHVITAFSRFLRAMRIADILR